MDKYFESICVPFSVDISLSASPTSKFKSKICRPGLVTLRNFFSLSDSSSFTLLANTRFFTYSRFFTLSLVFSACSRSVRAVFHLHSRQSRTKPFSQDAVDLFTISLKKYDGVTTLVSLSVARVKTNNNLITNMCILSLPIVNSTKHGLNSFKYYA